ncbi:F-type H+-transporting ATPase subunit b [Mesonia hippocampi]|uniref:ATP synthase subunit b n=1 Tax=Mesonia hippocampi TaxID=1628250 RepID=A0A840EZ69_9FLAO|nr:F0F1 ATP synthase subunit B [Mesonia hippocampi]MBB4119324.1 F-type H+-transporting ATPase subunit b [Mesonia hippocampi]
MNLITPEFGLIFWQTIVLLVLIFLMAKFAWKPILSAVKKREDSINGALDAAEKARLEMENLKASNEKLLAEARAERDNMLKEARSIKDKMIAEATEDAQEKANKILTNAQQSIEAEKKAALAEVKNEVATLSLEIAQKVVMKELASKEDQMKLVNNMLEDVKLN